MKFEMTMTGEELRAHREKKFRSRAAAAEWFGISVRRVGVGMEIYPIQLDDRLPRFRIPLRPKDSPAILDLQAAIETCYEEGQYWKRLNYEIDELNPRPSDEMLDWLDTFIGHPS